MSGLDPDRRVVATAGHVDHGKSALVRALTGTDPDRLAEEQRRGLTIELGFAHTELAAGTVGSAPVGISFVDVPGHARFLRNMLAGVGAVDAVLLVVDAGEGWKPQTEEHVQIVSMLGVRRAVVALTKIDRVGPAEAAGRRDEIAARLAPTPLAGSMIVDVSAVTGAGLDELRSALAAMVSELEPALDREAPRLWIDRAFVMRGSGTVVTGTTAHGGFGVGDRVIVSGHDEPVRIRALQTAGADVDSIGPGRRAAINLSGIGADEIRRGAAVVRPDDWWFTDVFDAELHVLATVPDAVGRRGSFLAYLGAGEEAAGVRILGSETIEPGSSGLVRLRLPVAVPLVPGDRYVLRDAGRDLTIGGGEVLDVGPVTKASRARPDRRVERIVAERGWVDADELALLIGRRHEATVGSWVVDPDVAARARSDLVERVRGRGDLGLDVAALAPRDRAMADHLAASPDAEVVIRAGRVVTAGAAADEPDLPGYRALVEGGLTPPDAAPADRAALRDLARRGLVVERDGVWFAADAIDAARDVARRLLATDPAGFTVAQFRDAAGVTRKYALPLLGLLDAAAITRRRDDVRIAGPRLTPRQD